MSQKTQVHTTDGKITGKTVSESSGGWNKTTEYKNTSTNNYLGPHYTPVSTTVSDPKGNTNKKNY